MTLFGYYLDLALRSFKRNKMITALMILTIGFGVAASMTTWSVFRAVSGDPIPWKSSQLFVPQIDNWGPAGRVPGSTADQLPDAMDYTDAVALMRAHRAKYQAAMYQIAVSVVPQRPGEFPVLISGEAVSNEFFPMLDVPFKHGSGWSATDDKDRARVVVINSNLNDQVFGGGDSVGKTLRMGGHEYQVVGVLDHWRPQPVFYDVSNTGGFNPYSGDVFMPFTTAIATDTSPNGSTNCSGGVPKQPGFAGLRKSSCAWISFMVQLDGAAAARRYREFLHNYAAEQQQAGRFHWSPDTGLDALMAWLRHEQVVPSNVGISLYVALGLLVVCLVNTMGLMLAKFLRRSGEIGVRRALGASRREIYMQFMIEAGMVGVAGGFAGLVLTALGVAGIGWVLPLEIASLAHLNVSLLVTTLGVAILATLLAGLYPTLRAAAVQPAWQLKSN